MVILFCWHGSCYGKKLKKEFDFLGALAYSDGLMKFNSSINTIGTKKHAWSVSRAGEIGVLREGVAKSLSAAMRAIRDAKRNIWNVENFGSLEQRESAWAHAVLTGGE